MSGFDAALVGVIVAFIGFFISEWDHPERRRVIVAVFAVCVVVLIALAWYAGWDTILPLPGHARPVSPPPVDPDSVPTPTPTPAPITMDDAWKRIRQGIEEFIAQLLVYGILIGVVFRMITSLFRR